MHIRLLQHSDITDLVDMIYDVYQIAAYAEGSGPLSHEAIKATIMDCLNRPEVSPCFVHDTEEGRLSGFLHGYIVETLFEKEKWFREQVFFIRTAYRSLPLAVAYIEAVETWCREQGISRVELGNGVSQDIRIGRLYKRMGYEPVNTIYARRL